MIKSIIILGSTGSIGESTIKVIRKDKKQFKIQLLSTNENINKIYKQAVEFQVKKVVIFNKNKYFSSYNKFKKKKYKGLSLNQRRIKRY